MTSRTQDLLARRHAAVARGVGAFTGDVAIASATSGRLLDVDGRELIDLSSGIGVSTVGHCDPAVVRAIQAQAEKLLHICIHVATYEPYVELCERLTTLLPHGEATKAMLVNTGVEAVENAVKIARQATGRQAIVAFEGGFHGRTLLGMTLTSKSAYKRGCGPFAPEIYRARYPNHFKYNDGLDVESFSARELRRLEEAFTLGPVPVEHIAAFLIEPILGEGGVVVAPPSYLRGLRELCDRHGILLICDEVQTGLCRTGRWAAYEHAGITPDLSTWAKALGGGMPIGAVIGKASVMDAAEIGTLGGTFGGNPVSCAAALATLDQMEKHDLCGRAATLGDRMMKSLRALEAACPDVAEVRGLGAICAILLCHDGDPERPAAEIVDAAVDAILARGVLVLRAGPHRNGIRLLPPLTIDDDVLDRALDIVASCLLEAARDHRARVNP